MDKQVNFKIKIDTDGAEKVHKVSVDAVDLAENINKVTKAQSELNSEMVNINQLAELWHNLYQGIQQVGAVMVDLTAAYNTQEQAEVKLDTIMRQRMGATDGMVESVKQLCSEQQQLGVIGDEVQLSGAQQMATFLNEKQSLDQLIPAMNNLLAQQKGLNATEQDAVSIGNMMGKAMQGQVDVLQRVGISFTEAQKEVLKYGTEQERAAMLAEVIKQNVGEMNKRLAETDGGKAKQVANTLGDMKEVLGGLIAPLQKTLMLMSTLGGTVNTIVMLTQGMKGLSSSHKVAAINAGMNAVATRILSAANVTAAGTTRALTIAIKGLMIASGVGLVVVALTTAIEAMTGVMGGAKGSAQDAAKGMEDFGKAANTVDDAYQNTLSSTYADMMSSYEKLKQAWKSLRTEQQKIAWIRNNQSAFNDLKLEINNVTDAENAFNSNTDAVVDGFLRRAKAAARAAQLTELYRKQTKL